MPYPSTYDTIASTLPSLANLIVLQVTNLQNVSGNWVFTVTGDITSLSLDTPLTYTYPSANGVVEIVKVTAKGSGTVTALRQQEGTSLLGFDTGAILVQEMTASTYASIRSLLLRSQKYSGLVGSSLPATCSPGEFYFRTTDSTFHVCFVTNTWERVDNADHAALLGLSSDTAHSIYQTEAAFGTWHASLTGTHITSATTHNHSTAAIRKIRSGLVSALGTPAKTGDLFYATDTKTLYFSNNGSTWTIYSTLPKNSIFMFASSCPSGWTRVSGYDGKFLKGAGSGVWSGLITGGTASHSHTMSGLVTHTHDINTQSLTVANTGSHSHNVSIYSSSGSNTIPFSPGTAAGYGSQTSGSSGSHSHSVTIPAINTDSVGTAAPVTNSTTNMPAYYKIVFCKKD